MNIDKSATYGPAGAGAGSTSSGGKSVGLKVPELIWFWLDKPEAAALSNVSVILLTTLMPPQSDMSHVFCPAGPTNKTSRSCGCECERPLSVAVAFMRLGFKPETLIAEGYGAAAPVEGTAIEVLLKNEVVRFASCPNASVVLTVPRLAGPS